MHSEQNSAIYTAGNLLAEILSRTGKNWSEISSLTHKNPRCFSLLLNSGS